MDLTEEPPGQAVQAELDDQFAEPPAPPTINSIKVDALRRLKALERRGKTLGTHPDELRALMTILFELLPDSIPTRFYCAQRA